MTVPRTIWSACLGSTPKRMVRSTVSSNLANFTFWRRGTASCSVYGRDSTAPRAFSTFLPAFFILLLVSHRRPLFRCGRGLCDQRLSPPQNSTGVILSAGDASFASPESKDPYPAILLRYDFDAHRPRRALHALDRRFHRRRIQVRHLLLGDLQHLLLRDLSNLVL